MGQVRGLGDDVAEQAKEALRQQGGIKQAGLYSLDDGREVPAVEREAGVVTYPGAQGAGEVFKEVLPRGVLILVVGQGDAH